MYTFIYLCYNCIHSNESFYCSFICLFTKYTKFKMIDLRLEFSSHEKKHIYTRFNYPASNRLDYILPLLLYNIYSLHGCSVEGFQCRITDKFSGTLLFSHKFKKLPEIKVNLFYI